ncbi:MAG TPA: carbamoyl-phosphate synthase large subunit, partial [Proteobacteria bacterium]|nr:carbamoyl-phosphate synthase large subunit [Pseudomonadota bacterium]
MPPRRDIESILIVGSGPIVIGQACEFDYSGTQACKALKAEGYRVVLVNSNPATIMTDPEMAHVTYIEPLTAEFLTRIIERERPDAILPTLGGQTALNLACELHESGVLEEYGVELIGASYETIIKAENREQFKRAMSNIGLDVPKSGYASSLDEAWRIVDELGFPVIIRPSFTLGGTGGNVAYNREEFDRYARWGLSASPKNEILVEQSVLGWKEFELEVMRDKNDNVVIVCSIENFDPMGVHTGDSITVAPAQTLTDKEYQIMRDAAIAIIREIGVETGGSNIQFAVNPEDGRMVVIEMNPRVSRSSALASKATGFPIAKIAAKLAVGYTLDEIPNDITKETPASFEPTIDYVVVKVPRFNFEKFPEAERTLTTQMKSVGEVMAIGRTFKEALNKAIRSLENGRYSLRQRSDFIEDGRVVDEQGLADKIRIPCWNRVWYIYEALYAGWSVQRIAELSGIDPWFIENIKELVDLDRLLRREATRKRGLPLAERFSRELWNEAKRSGFSDRYLADILGASEIDVRRVREGIGVRPVYKMVDTCAAEFEA